MTTTLDQCRFIQAPCGLECGYGAGKLCAYGAGQLWKPMRTANCCASCNPQVYLEGPGRATEACVPLLRELLLGIGETARVERIGWEDAGGEGGGEPDAELLLVCHHRPEHRGQRQLRSQAVRRKKHTGAGLWTGSLASSSPTLQTKLTNRT